MRLPSPPEDVEGERVLPVLRSEEKNLVGPAPRDKGEYAVDQIAMRIEERQAYASGEVLRYQIGEGRGLARAGLAEQPEMAQPVIRQEPKPEVLAPPGCLPEDEQLLPGRLRWREDVGWWHWRVEG